MYMQALYASDLIPLIFLSSIHIRLYMDGIDGEIAEEIQRRNRTLVN